MNIKRIKEATAAVIDKMEITDPLLIEKLISIKSEDVMYEYKQGVAERHKEFWEKETAKAAALRNSKVMKSDEGTHSLIESASLKVYMSNELNRQQHCLTFNEKRIITVGAAMLTKYDCIEGHSPVVRVYLDDLISSFGMNARSARKALKEAALTLITKNIRWIDVDENGCKSYRSMSWTPEVKYDPNKGYLDIAIWHKVVPFLMSSPSGRFFTYAINNDFKKIKSKHTWRIFEIIKQWATFKGECVIEWDDLMFTLELAESYSNNFALTKAHIMNRAVKELKDILPFSFEVIRNGKSVSAIKFKPLQVKLDEPYYFAP